MQRKLYLLSYDVREPGRLQKTLKVVRDYATGGQKSVHECWLNETERQQQLRRLFAVMDLKQDSLLIIPLRRDLRVVTLGQARGPGNGEWFYYG